LFIKLHEIDSDFLERMPLFEKAVPFFARMIFPERLMDGFHGSIGARPCRGRREKTATHHCLRLRRDARSEEERFDHRYIV
jgi:hypothetical protein